MTATGQQGIDNLLTRLENHANDWAVSASSTEIDRGVREIRSTKDRILRLIQKFFNFDPFAN